MVRLFLLVFILRLALSKDQPVDPPLPSLSTDYYSGFVEQVFMSGDYRVKDSIGVSLVWNSRLILRVDSYNSADEQLGEGPISRIEDQNIGVVYDISRHSHKCVVTSVNQSADEIVSIKSLQDLLFLSLNYTYEGTRLVRSALVDTWSSQHSLTSNGIENALFQLAFTRPGTPIESINSYVEEPILWQFSLSGNESAGSFSSVLNFYEWSYDKPNTNVFDVSVCISSKDYELLVMLIAGQLSKVDEDHLHNSIRLAVTNYTGVYSFQVGNIKVIAENGSYVITSLQILNLTSEAQITTRVSAHDAVQTIKSGLLAGDRLPFSVELSPGVQVHPILHELSSTIFCPTNTAASRVLPCTVSPMSPCPTPAAINTSTLTLITTKFYSLSTCTAVVPTNMPQILTTTHTATKTIPCQSKPTSMLTPNALPCITTYPTSGTSSPCTHVHGLSIGGAFGLAIGSFIAGILCSLLLIVMCVACCNWCNRQTTKSAGWKPVPRTNHHITKEMDYFQ